MNKDQNIDLLKKGLDVRPLPSQLTQPTAPANATTQPNNPQPQTPQEPKK